MNIYIRGSVGSVFFLLVKLFLYFLRKDYFIDYWRKKIYYFYLVIFFVKLLSYIDGKRKMY